MIDGGQLQVTLKFIGTPSYEELTHLPETLRNHIRPPATVSAGPAGVAGANNPASSSRVFAPANLSTRFPVADPDALDLLKCLLGFQPKSAVSSERLRRITIDEALAHPYFTEIRQEALEVTAPDPLDAAAFAPVESNREELIRAVTAEIRWFRDKEAEESRRR